MADPLDKQLVEAVRPLVHADRVVMDVAQVALLLFVCALVHEPREHVGERLGR